MNLKHSTEILDVLHNVVIIIIVIIIIIIIIIKLYFRHIAQKPVMISSIAVNFYRFAVTSTFVTSLTVRLFPSPAIYNSVQKFISEIETATFCTPGSVKSAFSQHRQLPKAASKAIAIVTARLVQAVVTSYGHG